MRRALSFIFLVIGGWLLMGEPLIAFMNFGADARPHEPFLILGVLTFVAIPLAIGVALSPGDRRRELGLTILIAVGFGLVSGAAAVATLMDPGFKPFMPLMPPMPDIHAAPVVGVANLVAVTALGWWLYRRRARSAERAPAGGS